MAEFATEPGDYQRYGLDDPRCSVQRPTGTVRLSLFSSAWEIEVDGRQWTFARPPYVRKLHDRFVLQFSYADPLRPGLMLLVPFPALSPAEAEGLEDLAEKRHPANAPGGFYGVASECICIGACTPAEIAPDLVGYQEEPEGCYFARQPQTPEEVDLAVEAVLSAFVDSLRYGGTDPRIISTIRAATRNMKVGHCQGDLCDHPTGGSDRRPD